MEKRLVKRIPFILGTEFLSSVNISYAAFIRNISEYGLHMIITPMKTAIDFAPGTELELKFQIPSGETLNLYFQERWSYKILSHRLTKWVGIKILDPPAKYKEFLCYLRNS